MIAPMKMLRPLALVLVGASLSGCVAVAAASAVGVVAGTAVGVTAKGVGMGVKGAGKVVGAVVP